MNWKKIFFGLTALIVLVTIIGSVLSNNWIGVILSFIMLIGLAIFLKQEQGRDLVEEEKQALIKITKNTKHEFKDLYLSSFDDEIETTNKPYAKIEGYNKYANQHLFLIKEQKLFGGFRLLLIPSDLLVKIPDKKLSGNIVVKTTGFIPNGQIFEIPNNVGKRVADINLKAFSSNVGWSVAIDAQRQISKLIGIAVASDSNFLKQYAIEKQEEFKPEE